MQHTLWLNWTPLDILILLYTFHLQVPDSVALFAMSIPPPLTCMSDFRVFLKNVPHFYLVN